MVDLDVLARQCRCLLSHDDGCELCILPGEMWIEWTPDLILRLIDIESKTPQSKEEPMSKTLHNTDVPEAKSSTPDLKVVGNGDMFQLLCKASSDDESWMKSTKAMEIPGVGCVVQVTTQQDDHVAEALTFVPGVKIVDDENGGRRLEALWPPSTK